MSMAFSNSDLNKPNLKTLSLVPENQETPVHFITSEITPAKYFYRRNHFPYPKASQQSFLLPVYGEVNTPLTFPFHCLRSMPSRSIITVLECSGNKRSYFNPKAYGEQWEDGGISQGIWKGVSLRMFLNITGIKDTAREVVFIGQDQGTRTDMDGIFNYARSLSIEKALHEDTIIAYELNERPIPYEHGFPLRLIVPEWYGMASVKWLKEIQVIDYKFEGPFQTIDYMYYPHKYDDEGAVPVTNIKINSIIQQPQDYSLVDITENHEIYGIAWTGSGTINDVELSFDNGLTWDKTDLSGGADKPYAWTNWKYSWEVKDKGDYTIMCRARDSARNIQPIEAEWNRKGYGYNAVYTIHVKVE
jgi:DMSO/TMAO reductase YedYZ molybdopterin-dependent catalytic subunit